MHAFVSVTAIMERFETLIYDHARGMGNLAAQGGTD